MLDSPVTTEVMATINCEKMDVHNFNQIISNSFWKVRKQKIG